jgi:hypothetical protein
VLESHDRRNRRARRRIWEGAASREDVFERLDRQELLPSFVSFDFAKISALATITALTIGVIHNLVFFRIIKFPLFYLLSIHDHIDTSVPILAAITIGVVLGYVLRLIAHIPRKRTLLWLIFWGTRIFPKKHHTAAMMIAQRSLGDQEEPEERDVTTAEKRLISISTNMFWLILYFSTVIVMLTYYYLVNSSLTTLSTLVMLIGGLVFQTAFLVDTFILNNMSEIGLPILSSLCFYFRSGMGSFLHGQY